MIYVGIDVAKDKHDCCILNSDGKLVRDVFTFPNSADGFDMLFCAITDVVSFDLFNNVRIGLEATGHYSINLVTFIRSLGLEPVIFNPLSINLFRKAQTLRKTKTDKTDARFIAAMLFSQPASPCVPVSYHISELKVLTRNRSRLVSQRSRLKVSLSRLLDVIFSELSAIVWSRNQNSVHALLLELPNPAAIASCHLIRLTNILLKGSHGRSGKSKAVELKDLAARSIGSNSPAMAFELQQTIRLIRNVQAEIDLLEGQIKIAVDAVRSPLLTIPGISYTLAAIILAETGDISRFDAPAKLLAFAGMEPSTFQSGKFHAANTPMVKRGSAYLRWAILQAARLVSMRDPAFRNYMLKKKLEGKHHNVVMTHVGKKLVRVIFHMLKTNRSFIPQA
jgi:transposase